MEFNQQVRARVSFAAQERYQIIVEGREFGAVPAGALRWDGSLPAVGDWVNARLADESLAVIEEVLPRVNAISRKQPGRSHAGQVLAANVGLVIVVASLDHDFNPRRLERYLVLAAECGARVLVALNKAELCEDVQARVSEVQAIAPGVKCVTLSAIESVEPLRAWIGTGTVVLLGSSGVGKSTIVNGLLGCEQRQATQPVREHDSRGRHTTTHRMLFALPGGGALIDTPGLRELGLWAAQLALDEVFSEIAELGRRCRFADCSHGGEPDCAVSAALAEGAIEANRWASYQKLQAEVRHFERSNDKAAAAVEKQKWKVIHKAMRRHPKYRR